MGKIGEEITQQIKSAVKAKLIELGIEVDNELPDYIMVLVANKKSQAQMEKDLQLFLGGNTTLFTVWLLNVLKKLEEVTISKKNLKRIEVTNEKGCSDVVITKKEEDLEEKKSLKLAHIKVEPGTEQSEDCLVIRADPSLEEDTNNESGSNDHEGTSDYDDDDGEPTNQLNNKDNESEEQEHSPEHETEGENDVIKEDSSHDKLSSHELTGGSDHDSSHPTEKDQGTEATDSHQSDNIDQLDNTKPSSSRSKIVYTGIREQIDEVMEKTINDNRRPREEQEVCSNDRDKSISDRRRSQDDIPRSHDGRRGSFDSHTSQERRRLSSERSRRSPDHCDRLWGYRRKSPSDDHRRVSDRISRRSPEDRRRSPIEHRRNSDYRRRSPNDRRRLPLDRRRTRSPDVRRSSERRLIDDRRREANRRSPDDRGRHRVMDAREILKRKSNRIDDSSPASSEDPQGTEKRRKVVSLVHKPDSGREKSSEPQIPSLVRVTPRPVRKDAIQPNKKLLLLAVADAEKSISRRPSSSHSIIRKRELPKPEIKVLKMNDRRSSSPTIGYVPPEKIFITLTNQKYSNDDNGNYNISSREVSTRKIYDDSDVPMEDELLYEESYFDYDQEDADMDEGFNQGTVPEYVPVKVNEKSIQTKSSSGPESKCIISLESSPERSCDEWEDMVEPDQQVEKSADNASEIQTQTPEAEETEDISAAERSEENFEWSRLGPAPIATVKPLSQSSGSEKYKCEAMNKALERCRFWPSCLSETCKYYHPSSPCKMFPACKSGKECLFIHPDCKYGPACLNLKCPFLHKKLEDKKKVVEVKPAALISTGKSSPLIKCVYFPNCKNLNCKFWHPVKNCKYGRTCARSDCYFFHPTLVIPPKELLTWTSRN